MAAWKSFELAVAPHCWRPRLLRLPLNYGIPDCRRSVLAAIEQLLAVAFNYTYGRTEAMPLRRYKF